MTDEQVTPARLRALRIVAEAAARDYHTGGRSFARLMWPDSWKWHTSGRRGMPMTAGALLSRMQRDGLLRHHWSEGSYTALYDISERGRAILDREGHALPPCEKHDGMGANIHETGWDTFPCRVCGEVVPFAKSDR